MINTLMNNNNYEVSNALRWLATAIGGIMASIFDEVLPYITICTLVVLLDCLSAWALGRRAKKHYPKNVKKDTAKFKSSHFGKVIITLLKIYVLIVCAYLIQFYIFENLPMKLPNIAAGAVIMWQAWSILENESSCNNSKWARVAQKILVDKTARHLDMETEELEKLLNEEGKK